MKATAKAYSKQRVSTRAGKKPLRARELPAKQSYSRLLGRQEHASPSETIALIREGLGAGVIGELAIHLDEPKQAVMRVLGIPSTTAARLAKTGRRLDQAASERVARIAEIELQARRVFGERALAWLKQPNAALANSRPLDLLDTEKGAAEVRRILGAIEYGGVV